MYVYIYIVLYIYIFIFIIYIYKYNIKTIKTIMKTMCPPGYHHNSFVATNALGHMMYRMCPSVTIHHV